MTVKTVYLKSDDKVAHHSQEINAHQKHEKATAEKIAQEILRFALLVQSDGVSKYYPPHRILEVTIEE